MEKYKQILIKKASVSIAAGGTGEASITVPGNDRHFIKKINITKGADVSVTSLKLDGIETNQVASFDVETTFGAIMPSVDGVIISGSNAGLDAQTLEIEIVGFVFDM